ncbi:hypothetical protein DRW48_08690 [Paracoccus suum]|uniref:Uncharacterized protein n=1 Tax=Paracoccus suum TaxID=2259340 RepID=A0A344PK50_9RHOB|nr:hypothetical protein [Paracoccus suum]AXC49755.1 hypothetical protein DRW48_08690 [Paracoccus suum]
MRLPTLLLALCLALPVQAKPARGPIVINNDRGGNVLAMLQRRAQLERSGRPVEIRGYCRSACTMLITMRNACLAPNATVGFHAPRIEGTNFIPPIVDQIMAATYRGGIKRKWDSEWRQSLNMVRISAKQYVALDPQTRLCRR